MGNAVWVHSIDNTTGDVSELQYLPAASGSDPRHVAIHPNGAWAYIVYEAASTIAIYSRDTATGLLTFTNTTYSLLPSGKRPSSS
jgi:carboxy-cis,cis-muconate cyclase